MSVLFHKNRGRISLASHRPENFLNDCFLQHDEIYFLLRYDATIYRKFDVGYWLVVHKLATNSNSLKLKLQFVSKKYASAVIRIIPTMKMYCYTNFLPNSKKTNRLGIRNTNWSKLSFENIICRMTIIIRHERRRTNRLLRNLFSVNYT